MKEQKEEQIEREKIIKVFGRYDEIYKSNNLSQIVQIILRQHSFMDNDVCVRYDDDKLIITIYDAPLILKNKTDFFSKILECKPEMIKIVLDENDYE